MDANTEADQLFFTKNASHNPPRNAENRQSSYAGRGRGRGRGGRGRNTRKWCTHCNRNGHTLQECFKYNQNKPRRDDQPLPQNPDPNAKERAYVATEVAYVGNNSNYVGEVMEWIIDSGCTRHMTPYRHLFYSYERLTEHIPIMTGSNKMVYAVGKGTIHLTSELNYRIKLDDVLYVPGLTVNLMSVAACMRRGGKTETLRNMIVVSQYVIPHFYAHEKQGLFKARFKNLTHQSAYAAALHRSKEDITEWHCRLGHPNYTSMMKMAQKGLVHGLNPKLLFITPC